MPATESFVHSQGAPETFTLANDGRIVELRNGCIVDAETRQTLAWSDEAAQFIANHAQLTPDELAWWQTWGEKLCDRMRFSVAGFGVKHDHRKHAEEDT